MIETANTNAKLWYAIHTNPRQEERAYNNLRFWQVEVFFPKIKERRLNPYTGAATYITKSLFPGYIFARFNLNRHLHHVRFTRGVHDVVGVAGMPTPVQEELVTLIQMRADEDGYVRMDDDLTLGDKVVIKDGPLAGLMGVFKQETSEARRVIILLESISYQAHIVVERSAVQKYVGT